MDQGDEVPRQLDFRGCAVALSVREQALLEAASEELYPDTDVPVGVVVGKLAADTTDACSRRSVSY
jgi:hypothetical protein